jgi:hypothetical protein
MKRQRIKWIKGKEVRIIQLTNDYNSRHQIKVIKRHL